MLINLKPELMQVQAGRKYVISIFSEAITNKNRKKNGDIYFLSTPVPVRTKTYHYLSVGYVVIQKREQKKNISTTDIGAAYQQKHRC